MKRWLVTLLLLGLSACRDRGAEPFARARAQYEQLVAEGRNPRSSEYDQVLTELAKVPSGSRFAPKAEALSQAIARARSGSAPAPLAKEGVEGTEAECARLAQLLGEAPTQLRPELEHELDECRKKVNAQHEAEHPKTP